MDNRRKRYFVRDGDHQGILMIAGILLLVLILIASGMFYLIADRNLENATYRVHFDTLRHTMQMLLPWLVLVNLIGLIVVFLLAVFLTHRISGPVYHLISDLKMLGTGDLTVETKFRKHDRLKNVAGEFNAAVAGLRSVIVETKKMAVNLGIQVENHPELKDIAENINRNLEKLKT